MAAEDLMHALDLGPSDVHIDSASTSRKAKMAKPTKKPRKRAMAAAPVLPEKKRKSRRIHVRADLAHGGVLHVRHMNDDAERSVHCSAMTVALADGDSKRVWIQLADFGAFKGHPTGPFEITPQTFTEICSNFTRGKLPIPIDAEHASEQDPASGSIPEGGAPAMGWIHELDNRGRGGLWGLVEWLEPAKSYIKEGRYKYISPAIRFNARDLITGERVGAKMTSAGITNRPFLRSLKPITARDDVAGEVVTMGSFAYSSSEYMPRIKSALGMNSLCTARECSDQMGRLREHFDAANGDASGRPQGVPLADYLHPLRAIAGGGMGTTWDEVFDIIDDLIDAALEESGEMTASLDDDEGGDTEMSDADPDHQATQLELSVGGESTIPISEQENVIMADAAKTETVLLTEVRGENAVLLSENAKLKNDAASLKLDLKEATAKAETAETELKTLRDEHTKRKSADEVTRVEEAFETYKDKKNLSDDDRESMVIELRANAERFEKRYPKVAASERHLLRDLTGAGTNGGRGGAAQTQGVAASAAVRTNPAAESPINGGAAPVTISLSDLTKQIMKDKKLGFADAQAEASRIMREQGVMFNRSPIPLRRAR